MLCGAAWQDQYIAEASVVALMMQMDAEFTKRTLRAPCGARVRPVMPRKATPVNDLGQNCR